ncbi:MAG: hypothetical protein NC043_06900 [Muribaculaceae bacterium]|nr:hypothetical protein [Muribaculaceae bacterium]
MMPTSELTALNPGLSKTRIGMVAAYYYPLLKLQMVLYPCVAIALGIMQFVLSRTEIGFIFGSMLGTVINFMVYFAPCVFARRGDRYIEVLLPATGMEKSIFIIGYSLVVLPVVTWGLFAGTMFLLEKIWPYTPEMQEFADVINQGARMVQGVWFVQRAQEYVPLSTCLYCVLTLKNNRMIMSMVWTVVSLIAMGLAGVIFGIVMALSGAFKDGFIDGVNGLEPSADSSDMLAQGIIHAMRPFLYIMSGISAAYTLLMAWLSYRKISGIQI